MRLCGGLDGEVFWTDLTSDQWLLRQPNGTYTTMRTLGTRLLLEFESHASRLVHSLQSIDEFEEVASESELVALKATLLSACQRLCKAFHASGNHRTVDYKITVLIPSRRHNLAKAEAPERSVTIFQHQYVPVLLVDSLWPPPSNVVVEVRTAARTNPLAKQTKWVRDRLALWEMKSPDVNEVVMVTPEGAILEGTQSNFFAIVNNTIHYEGQGLSLQGTILMRLLAVCQASCIATNANAPTVDFASEWQGAYLTSTSRLVLPIDELRFPEYPEMAPLKLDSRQNELGKKLAASVEEAVLSNATPLWEAQSTSPESSALVDPSLHTSPEPCV
jgi:thiol oxidase